MKRTRASVCARKVAHASMAEALRVAAAAAVPLRPYRCDRCGQVHLTSRTKGKRVPRPDAGPLPTVISAQAGTHLPEVRC